jgi:predicted transcriptional regulator
MLETLEFSINKYNLYAHISKLAEKGLVKVERHGLNQVQITKKGLLLLKKIEESLNTSE